MQSFICRLLVLLAIVTSSVANERVPRLLEELRSSSVVERAEAARALGAERDARVGPALVAALRDTDRFVRWRAAEALERQKYAAAVAELERLASADPDATVRETAAAAASAIKQTPEYSVHAAGGGGKDEIERQRAADRLAFAAESSQAIPALMAALSDNSSNVRAAAARSLGIRKAAVAVPVLADMLRATARSDHTVASAAAEALGQIGDHRAVDALLAAIRGYSVAAGPALKALALLKDPRSIPGILELQRHDSSQSYEVAQALKAMGQPGLDALVGQLEVRPALPMEERLSIATAIVYTQDPRIEAAVARVLAAETDPIVRRELGTALARMRGR